MARLVRRPPAGDPGEAQQQDHGDGDLDAGGTHRDALSFRSSTADAVPETNSVKPDMSKGTAAITPRIAWRGIDSSERLGRHRWVVERTLAWLLGCRRLGVRYERRADLLQGLLHLACALVCVRFLGP